MHFCLSAHPACPLLVHAGYIVLLWVVETCSGPGRGGLCALAVIEESALPSGRS